MLNNNLFITEQNTQNWANMITEEFGVQDKNKLAWVSDVAIPKPDCLKLLLEYASILAKGHPQVRVDFYITHGKIYFGEMTFTSEGGYDGDITKEFCIEMGKHITLPQKK